MTVASPASAQESLDARAHEFAEGTIRPLASGWDHEPRPIAEGLAAGRAAGLFTPGWGIPNEIDDPVTALQVFESVGWGCAGFAYALHAAGLAVRTVRAVGSPAQVEELLPIISDGADGPRVGGVAISEPGAGSDIAAIATMARLDGDAYVLTGHKTFVTNALDAAGLLVYATTDRSLGWAGIAPYLVPTDTPGLEIRPTARPMGVRAGRFGDLTLTDCRIPVSHSLGPAERSPSLAGLRILESSRPVVAAIAVGLARAAYEYSLAHTKRREQFGRPLAAQQSIAFTLADMAMRIQAARLLTWHAGTMASRGGPQRQGESSMAKCFATEVAMATTISAVQLVGGAGCTDAHPVEKWMRDAKLLEICEGPSEIQRLIISRAILHP